MFCFHNYMKTNSLNYPVYVRKTANKNINCNKISFSGCSNSNDNPIKNFVIQAKNKLRTLIQYFKKSDKNNSLNKVREDDFPEFRAQLIKKTILDNTGNKEDAQFAYTIAKLNSEFDEADIEDLINTPLNSKEKELCIKCFEKGLAIEHGYNYQYPNFNDEAIETAVKIKKAGFECDDSIIESILEGKCSEKDIDILIKMKNAGFFAEEALEYACKMDDKKLKSAILLRDAYDYSFMILDTASRGVNEKQIKQLCTLKKAGLGNDEKLTERVIKGLDDDAVEDLIKIKTNIKILHFFTRHLLKFYDKGLKDKTEIFNELGNFFQTDTTIELMNKEMTQEDARKLIERKIALIIEDKDANSIDNIKNYPDENSEKHKEEIDEIIYFVKNFNMTDYNAASAVCPYILAKEPLIRKKDILNALEVNKAKSLDSKTQEKLNRAIERVKESINHTITPQKINPQRRKELWSGFLANNRKIEETIKNADFAKLKTKGLELEYPRKDFIEDLNKILKPLSNEEKADILNKLEIILTKDKKGYDGIINLEKLNLENETEAKVFKIADKFLNKNKINPTEDENLDMALNSLINGLSEFINIIGKEQHKNQAYSVDIHILKVFQNALLNPEYEKLSPLDKTCLKLAIILHDIAKQEGELDKSHPEISARYAQDILEEYNLPYSIKTRVTELIFNHHWFENYNKQSNTAKAVHTTAAFFRQKDDYNILKIMTKADIEGIGNEYFLSFVDDLNNEEKQKPLINTLNEINSSGQIFIPSKIVLKNKIPTVKYKNKTYKVVNIANLNRHENLEKFGFEKGTTKENLRLLIHMTDAKDIKTLFNLEKTVNQGLLSASYISCENKETYGDRKFGLSLEALNTNIANATKTNQGSGTVKDFNDFCDFLQMPEHRNLISKKIKEILGLSDEEYREFYEIIAPKKYFSQITSKKTYKIKNKEINSNDIVKAIRIAGDEIIGNNQNEVLLYTPKINGFIAKVDKIDEIPQDYLDLVEKHNLPIFIVGK